MQLQSRDGQEHAVGTSTGHGDQRRLAAGGRSENLEAARCGQSPRGAAETPGVIDNQIRLAT